MANGWPWGICVGSVGKDSLSTSVGGLFCRNIFHPGNILLVNRSAGVICWSHYVPDWPSWLAGHWIWPDQHKDC
ncbi:MAG: hypothetical protein R3B47_05815 [Bacteroidia bacterium]